MAEGATRETWEEANAHVEGVLPYFHIDIPRIGQVRDAARFHRRDSQGHYPYHVQNGYEYTL